MKKFLNNFATVLSIVFTFILTILLILFCILLNTKNYFTDVNVGRVASDTDMSKVVYLLDKDLYDNLTSLLKLINVDEELVSSIINGNHIKNTVSEYIVSVYNGVINDEEIKELEKEDLLLVVEEAIDTINEEKGNVISNTSKGMILDLVDKESYKILDALPNEEEVRKLINENDKIDIAKKVLSKETIIISISTILVILLIIGLLTYSSYKWLSYLGLSLSISSIVFILYNVIYNVIEFYIELDNELSTYIVNILINNLMSNFFITGIILLLLAIFVFILYNTIKKGGKKTDDFEESDEEE